MNDHIGYLLLIYALPVLLCAALFVLFFEATWFTVAMYDIFRFIKSDRRRAFVEYGIAFAVAAAFLLPLVQLFRLLGWL